MSSRGFRVVNDCMSSVVVLMSLGRITYDQGQYHESVQMYGRSLDILMKVSPKSMKTATGRQRYDWRTECHCVHVNVCSVSQHGSLLCGVITI